MLENVERTMDGISNPEIGNTSVLIRIFPWLCGLAAYIVYQMTNTHGIYWGDAGEFVAAANTLGIGHPYGHPLFWLVGRLSILTSPHNPAGAMSHLTALVSGATCMLIAVWVGRLCKTVLKPLKLMTAMFVVSGTYALAATVWTQATFTEVYNFQAFFIVSALILFHRYFVTKLKGALYASAYCLGLSITLGLYAGLLLIVPILVVLFDSKMKIPLKSVLISAIFLLFGLTIWIYLSVRSGLESLLFWERIETMKAFFGYIGRKQFLTSATAGSAALSTSFKQILAIWSSNIGILGSGLILASFWAQLIRKKNRTILAFTFCGLLLIIVFGVSIPLTLTFRQMVDMDVYFIPVFLVLIPALALGVKQLLNVMRRGSFLLLLIPIFIIGFFRWNTMDVSDSHIIEAFSDYLATHIPEHSFVFPVSDEVAHPLLYRILAQKNPENFQLLRGSQVLIEEIDTRWNQNGSPIVIEIDDQFLQRFVTNDSVRIGGPFIVPARDSISAIQLESAFIQHFSPEALESENLTRLDRLSFARIWSRRGVYWFHLNRMSELMGTQSSAYLKQAIFNFKAACSFDPFSLEGALHASNLAIALTKTGDMEEAKKIALQALALSPDAPDAYRALYLIAVKNQAYDTALTHLVKLSALRPKDGETRINIAALLILLNRIDEARTEYRRGIERGGKPRDALETILSPGHSSE